MENPTILGVDIGGSHITAAVVDLEKGAIIESSLKRKVVDAKASAKFLIAEWTEVIKSAYEAFPKVNVQLGIAVPGPFDYENGISLMKDQDKFKLLYQIDVKAELAKSIGIAPDAIRFLNDAASFMQGEVYGGAAKGYKNALGLTLGTGLGAATAINGVTKDADLWNASFLGGIAEDYFSTRWFVKKYEDLTGNTFAGVKELAEIADVDPYAKQIFNEFGRGLGHFLADVIKANGTEVVVLGGNIAQAYPLFQQHLISNLRAYHLDTEVKRAQLNENATLLGAASQWSERNKIVV
jgi:glucokinase